MDRSGVEQRQINSSIERDSGVTPLSFVRDPSSFASQSSLFRGGGARGKSFGIGVGGGVGVGGEGGG